MVNVVDPAIAPTVALMVLLPSATPLANPVESIDRDDCGSSLMSISRHS